MREKFVSLCDLHDKTVEIVRLHSLVQPDDVGVAQPAHELCLTQKVLADIVFLDLVSLNDLDCNLQTE